MENNVGIFKIEEIMLGNWDEEKMFGGSYGNIVGELKW